MATALFRFGDSYARKLPGLSVSWAAAPVDAPELLVLNAALAVDLGAAPAALREQPGVLLMVGQAPGVATVAQAYAAHQFAVLRAPAGGRPGAAARRGDRHPWPPP